MFKIKGENFLSYKEIEFDFRKRGLVSIEGKNEDEPLFSSNGSGKSSLIDALSWGLYGISSKGDTADSVINNIAGKDCWMEVEFNEFTIKRYRQHSKFKNDLQFFINGVEQTGKSNKETQSRIEQLIGLNHSSFIHSIYFAQNNLNNFASATDARQKEIIENILGLNTITHAQEWCKEKSKSFNNSLDKKEQEIETKNSSINQIKTRIDDLNNKSEKFELIRESEKKNIFDNINILEKNKIMEPLIDVKKAIDLIELANSKQSEYEEIANKKNIIELEIKKLNNQKLEKINEINKIRIEKNNQNNKIKIEYQKKVSDFKISQSQLDNKITNCRSDISKFKKELEYYSKSKEKTCPTCNQNISDSFSGKKISDIEKKIDELSNQEKILLNEFNSNKLPTEPSIEIFVEDDVVDDIAPQIKTKELEKTSIDEDSKKIRSMLDTASQLKLKVEQEKHRLAENELIQKRIEDWEVKLIETKSKANPYLEQIEQETYSKCFIENELHNLKLEKENIEDDIKHHDYWTEGFSNRKLKSFIMESVTPFINEKANLYSKFMTGGSFIIDISTQTINKSGDVKEKFSVGVNSQHGANYSTASGGERRRIDLCILLALQDLVASRAKTPLKILILDECTENLDSVGVERMIELLSELSNTKESVLFITHDDTLKNYFPNRVSILKKNGLSTIIQ